MRTEGWRTLSFIRTPLLPSSCCFCHWPVPTSHGIRMHPFWHNVHLEWICCCQNPKGTFALDRVACLFLRIKTGKDTFADYGYSSNKHLGDISAGNNAVKFPDGRWKFTFSVVCSGGLHQSHENKEIKLLDLESSKTTQFKRFSIYSAHCVTDGLLQKSLSATRREIDAFTIMYAPFRSKYEPMLTITQ